MDRNSDQDRTGEGPRTLRHFRRFEALEGLEVLRADFGRYRFPVHAHDRDVVSLIARGSHTVERRGSVVVAGEGSIVMMPRGRPHSGGHGGGAGWHIMTLYLPEGLLGDAAGELTGPRAAHVPDSVTRDLRLRQALTRIHGDFARAEAAPLNPLAQHERLLEVLGYALRCYGPAQDYCAPGAEPRAVRRVRDYLQAHWAETVTLAELSAIAGFSPFRLTRVFKAATGLPPHAYQIQLRVTQAQDLLRAGRPIAEVALACGFADQSHLTRTFKRSLGFTPGQFRTG